MTDKGTYVSTEVGENRLEELVEIVRKQGRTVRICMNGEPVAELSPPKPRRKLTPVDPCLRVTFGPDYDPCAGLDVEDWPEEQR